MHHVCLAQNKKDQLGEMDVEIEVRRGKIEKLRESESRIDSERDIAMKELQRFNLEIEEKIQQR